MATLYVVLTMMALAYWRVRNARRLRLLSEQELVIASSVTRMEKLMRKGDLKGGDASHDTLYELMQYVMYNRAYALPWSFKLKGEPSEESAEFGRRLREELNQKKCPFKEILDDFMKAYYRAFVYKHPVLSRVFVLRMMFHHATSAKAPRTKHKPQKSDEDTVIAFEYMSQTGPMVLGQQAA